MIAEKYLSAPEIDNGAKVEQEILNNEFLPTNNSTQNVGENSECIPSISVFEITDHEDIHHSDVDSVTDPFANSSGDDPDRESSDIGTDSDVESALHVESDA